jgi:hypothetical protein
MRRRKLRGGRADFVIVIRVLLMPAVLRDSRVLSGFIGGRLKRKQGCDCGRDAGNLVVGSRPHPFVLDLIVDVNVEVPELRQILPRDLWMSAFSD